MNRHRPHDDFILLATQLVEDGLSDADYNRLQEQLRDESNAAWFVEWMELNAMLQMDVGAAAHCDLAPTPLAVPRPVARAGQNGLVECTGAGKIERRPAWKSLQLCASLMVAVVLLLAIGFYSGLAVGEWGSARGHSGSRSNASGSPLAGDNLAEEVATITGGIGVEFAGDLSFGSRIRPGRLRVEQGVAEIVFDHGAVVVLQGPAELDVVDAGTCRLVSGSISAEMMPRAAGFCIDAGGFQVGDINANFGLRTQPHEATELHVFGGEVQLVGFGGSSVKPQRVGQGNAIRWFDKSVTGIAMDATSFVTRQELAMRLKLVEQRQYRRWLDYSQRWFDDPSVLLRYDFAPNVDSVIVNTVDNARHVATPRTFVPRWIAGRWSIKQAMLFDGRTDALVVPDRPELRIKDTMTLALWMRIRSYAKHGWTRIVGKGGWADRNYGLWIDEKGKLLWQICHDADPQTQADWDRYDLRGPIAPIGEWIFVVGVIDKDEARIYVDGEFCSALAAPDEIATSDDPLTIGYYGDVPSHDNFFCGELDELILLDRVLSDREIRKMYEAGRSDNNVLPFVPEASFDDDHIRAAAPAAGPCESTNATASNRSLMCMPEPANEA